MWAAYKQRLMPDINASLMAVRFLFLKFDQINSHYFIYFKVVIDIDKNA